MNAAILIFSKNAIPISASIIIFLLMLAIFLAPNTYLPSYHQEVQVLSEHFCRDMTKNPNPPILEAPGYSTSGIDSTLRNYRLIKERVPMDFSLYDNVEGHHFFPGYKQKYTDPQTGKKYIIRLPNGEQGRSYKLPSEVGSEDYLTFAEYGLLYLFPADDNWNPIIMDWMPIPGAGDKPVAAPDIYKAVDTPDLPEWVLKCIDAGTGGQTDKIVYGGKGYAIPPQKPSSVSDELQLEWFLMRDYKLLLQAWWTPHCKPAIYLYPEQTTIVNVKVFPRGELSYTDPIYDPKNGWTIQAERDGVITTFMNNLPKKYPYLYYESRILDSELKKPERGWVISGKDLDKLFSGVLPRLGLNEKEKNDFSNYWLGVLPTSPFYFVGLIEKQQRDYLERLQVIPEPETSIRFSLYFEPLTETKEVVEPQIVTPKRTGFTLVDWGGMIKLHPGTPFTCSQ